MWTWNSPEIVLRRSMRWAAQGVGMQNMRWLGHIPPFICQRRFRLKVNDSQSVL